MSSCSFLESSVIDLLELSFCAWFTTRIASYAAVSLGLCLLDGDFNILPEGMMNKMNRRFLHGTLVILFHNGLLLSKSLSMTLDLPSYNSQKEALSLKDACWCDMLLHRSSTQNHQTGQSTN